MSRQYGFLLGTLRLAKLNRSPQVPLDYAQTVCNLFAQLGARGSSVMFSSGDDGVGGGDCLTNDGKNTKQFQPNFPGTRTSQ